jgi:hypothetical protein
VAFTWQQRSAEMNINFFRAAIFSLAFVAPAFVFNVRAQSFELRPNQAFRFDLPIETASIFSVENQIGDINIAGGSGDKIILAGRYQGSKPATLHFQETERGKIKIFIKYPSGGGSSVNISGGGIFISGGGVVVSSINGRNVTVSGGKITVDGKEVSGDSSFGSRGANLELEIPEEFLKHLKARSEQGNVSVAKFEAGDKSREIELESGQGNVVAENVSASGGINLTTEQGNINASKVRGRLEMFSKQGEISAFDNVGDIRAKTEMGNVRIEGQKGHVDAKTGMGDIHLNNPDSLSEKAETEMGEVFGRKPCKDSLGKMGRKKNTFDF